MKNTSKPRIVVRRRFCSTNSNAPSGRTLDPAHSIPQAEPAKKKGILGKAIATIILATVNSAVVLAYGVYQRVPFLEPVRQKFPEAVAKVEALFERAGIPRRRVAQTPPSNQPEALPAPPQTEPLPAPHDLGEGRHFFSERHEEPAELTSEHAESEPPLFTIFTPGRESEKKPHHLLTSEQPQEEPTLLITTPEELKLAIEEEAEKRHVEEPPQAEQQEPQKVEVEEPHQARVEYKEEEAAVPPAVELSTEGEHPSPEEPQAVEVPPAEEAKEHEAAAALPPSDIASLPPPEPSLPPPEPSLPSEAPVVVPSEHAVIAVAPPTLEVVPEQPAPSAEPSLPSEAPRTRTRRSRRSELAEERRILAEREALLSKQFEQLISVLQRQEQLTLDRLHSVLALQDELHTRKMAALQEQFEAQLAEARRQHARSLEEALAATRRAEAEQYRQQLEARAADIALHYRNLLDAKVAELSEAERAEREQRLAALRELHKRLREQAAKLAEYVTVQSQAASTDRLALALLSLEDAVEHRAGAAVELPISALREAGAGNPVIEATLAATVRQLQRTSQLYTDRQLAERWNRVRVHVRRAGFVPPNGGLWWHVWAIAMERVTVPPEGSTASGESTEDIVARTDHYVQQGDWERAVAELCKLKGEPAELARDWLERARDVVAMKKLLAVMRAEVEAQLRQRP